MRLQQCYKCRVDHNEAWTHDEEQTKDVKEVLRSKVRIDIVGNDEGERDLVIDDTDEFPDIVQVLNPGNRFLI